MVKLSEIFLRHFPAYEGKYGKSMPKCHRRAAEAILGCEAAAFGGHLFACEGKGCSHMEWKPHSCCNRMCPRCQKREQERWRITQKSHLLPVDYYHLVFTLPAKLRDPSRANQSLFLGALFDSVASVLKSFAADEQWLGGKSGFICFLHTWGDSMVWHPHIHVMMPAIALGEDGEIIYPRHKKFLFPQDALAAVFRARYLALLKKRQPDIKLPWFPKKKKWIEFCKKIPGEKAGYLVDYLARYCKKSVIDESRILSCDDESVTFLYRPKRRGKGCEKRKPMTLTGEEWLHRFLQHTPRKGMARLRYYGFLHPSCLKKLRRMQLLLCNQKQLAQVAECEQQVLQFKQPMLCPDCACVMHPVCSCSELAAENLMNQRAPPKKVAC